MCINLHVHYYGTEKRSFNAFKVHRTGICKKCQVIRIQSQSGVWSSTFVFKICKDLHVSEAQVLQKYLSTNTSTNASS